MNKLYRIFAAFCLSMICLCGSAKEIRTIPIVQNDTNLFREIRDADSVIIYWNAAPTSSDSVKFYELSYRTPTQTSWTLLKTNIPPAPSTEVVVYRTDVTSADSVFYFNIQYETVSGQRSAAHYTSDPDANLGGWILIWKKKQR